MEHIFFCFLIQLETAAFVDASERQAGALRPACVCAWHAIPIGKRDDDFVPIVRTERTRFADPLKGDRCVCLTFTDPRAAVRLGSDDFGSREKIRGGRCCRWQW